MIVGEDNSGTAYELSHRFGQFFGRRHLRVVNQYRDDRYLWSRQRRDDFNPNEICLVMQAIQIAEPSWPNYRKEGSAFSNLLIQMIDEIGTWRNGINVHEQSIAPESLFQPIVQAACRLTVHTPSVTNEYPPVRHLSHPDVRVDPTA